MIEDAPQLQTQPIIRPDSKLVEQLRGTPTGFLVDAMGGSGALDFRIKPAVLEQFSFVALRSLVMQALPITLPWSMLFNMSSLVMF